jgi:hypothetical protein
MAILYRHIRVDKNEPFYIGIGKNDKRQRQKETYRRNNIWNAIVAKTEYEIEILFEHDDYNFIKQKEKEFIKLYGRIDKKTGCLANMTDGGDGTTGNILTEKHKNILKQTKKIYWENNKYKHIGDNNVSKRKDVKDKLKISSNGSNNGMYGMIGELNPFFGKQHTKDTKKSISNSRKGKCMGESNPSKRLEVREKIRLKKIEYWKNKKTQDEKSKMGN